MKYAILPNREERRRSRRTLTIDRKEPQTYRVYATLSCGHKISFTRSARRLEALPKSAECWECANALAQRERAS